MDLTVRKCCACHAIQSLTKVDLAKVLRLPRNLHPTLPKCCACHAIQTLRNLCVAVPMGPAPNVIRDRSDPAPTPLRPDAADRLAFASPDRATLFATFSSAKLTIHAQGHAFCDFLFPCHTRAHVFSRAYSFSCDLFQRASFQLVAVTRKFLLNFL